MPTPRKIPRCRYADVSRAHDGDMSSTQIGGLRLSDPKLREATSIWMFRLCAL